MFSKSSNRGSVLSSNIPTVAFSSQRELFWSKIENQCEVYVSSDLWNMDDVNLAKTLLGQQMD
jgi:hypothetical protein